MMATVPWLNVMRTLLGTKEAPGSADNPVILGMRDEIKRAWGDVPGLIAYADTYQHDETPWCGLAAGYALSESGFMPPFKKGSDTDSWYWAQAWASDDNYVELSTPVPGAIAVLTRSGGGHVSLYERTEGSNVILTGGNQGDAVTTAPFSKSSVIGYFWPKDAPMPEQPRRDLQKGSTGPDVAELQVSLGIVPADGDFGAITEAQVCSFQAAAKLGADGVVGNDTWAAVDDLDARMAAGENGLSDTLCDVIVEIVDQSPLANYSWPDRGKAPRGYLNGMAMAYGVAVLELEEGLPRAIEMAQAQRPDDQTDALT